MECIALGWIFGAKKLREYLNSNTNFKYGVWWDVAIKYICPVIFLFISVTYLITNLKNPYDGYPVAHLITGGWAVVALTVVFGIIMSFIPTKDQSKSVENEKVTV